ncbi:MAG: SDR family NAD(P)-dependent oxidoreductase [Anaerolineae bacterium]|nr:SDR family NAD(P)-dependent oxidoreductase [Anaerolineae bacterium]
MTTQQPPTNATARVAFITGASSGIGYATALAFAREGVHVVAAARRMDRLAELQKAVLKLPAAHGDILLIEADVTRPETLAEGVKLALGRFGRLDILVANAGLGHRGSLVDADWSDIDTLLRTNIDGVLHSIRAAVPVMRASGGGHILIISSVTYNLTSPYAALYAASKAFVSSLAHSLRLELEGEHINVTDVLVGRTQTEFNDKRLGAGKRTGEGVPTMSPDQVAAAIVRATHGNPRSVIVRFFDRLLIWGNIFIPEIIGRIALRQYR